MSITRLTLYTSTLLATGLFTWTLAQAERSVWISLAVISGLLVAAAPLTKYHWLSLAGFLGYIWLAIACLWWELPEIWLLAGVSLMLVAWNLSQLESRLKVFGQAQVDARLHASYLVRVLSIAGAGFGMGLLALNIEYSLRFSVALLLTILAIGGLAVAMRLLLWEAR